MIFFGILGCIIVAILFSLTPLFVEKGESRTNFSAFILMIFIGVLIYALNTKDYGAGLDKGEFIRFTGTIASYIGIFLDLLILVDSKELKRGKSIVALIFIILIPLGFWVEDKIAEARFEHLCKTEAGVKVYKKIHLPKEYFHHGVKAGTENRLFLNADHFFMGYKPREIKSNHIHLLDGDCDNKKGWLDYMEKNKLIENVFCRSLISEQRGAIIETNSYIEDIKSGKKLGGKKTYILSKGVLRRTLGLGRPGSGCKKDNFVLQREIFRIEGKEE